MNRKTAKPSRENLSAPLEEEEEIDENELERRESRSRNEPPRLGLNFTEAVGKTVAFLNVINDPPEWQALEIRFTDGTLFHFVLQTTQVEIKAEYSEARDGDLKLIRN